MSDSDLLALLHHGPLDATSLCQRLVISQPTLSRRIAQTGDAIVRIGQARATRYWPAAPCVRNSASPPRPPRCLPAVRLWRADWQHRLHTGNLSFLHNGPHPLELVPAYDMLPMALAPNRQGDMRDSIPRPVQNRWVVPEVWAEVDTAASA
jgi:hypothetical protein